MAHGGAAVQQVVVTASEKRCWEIIERGLGSGSELFNQKGGELKGEIKMFLRFPDGFFPFPLKSWLSFFISASHPHPQRSTLSWGNTKNNLVFELGQEGVQRKRSIFLCMLKRTSQPNKSMEIFPALCL